MLVKDTNLGAEIKEGIAHSTQPELHTDIYLLCPQSPTGERGRPRWMRYRWWVCSRDKETWADGTDNLIRVLLVSLPNLRPGGHEDWGHYVYLLRFYKDVYKYPCKKKDILEQKMLQVTQKSKTPRKIVSQQYLWFFLHHFSFWQISLWISHSASLSDKSDQLGLGPSAFSCNMQC